MKVVSWNVNGIRACVNKGFLDFFNDIDADIFCIQESKCQEGQIELPLEGYYQYWNYALKKGYSGTAIFTKREPLSVSYGVGDNDSEDEGRIITLKFEKYYVVNVYTPNAKRTLERLEERLLWEDEIRDYLTQLNKQKPVIYCGDLNVAHQEIDLKNAKTNKGNSGFTEEERGKMTDLLNAGFIDSYRYLYPSKEGAYSWWSYMSKVRERNIGWRIDYVIVSENIKEAISDAEIHHSILGSDHCPVSLDIDEDKITVE